MTKLIYPLSGWSHVLLDSFNKEKIVLLGALKTWDPGQNLGFTHHVLKIKFVAFSFNTYYCCFPVCTKKFRMSVISFNNEIAVSKSALFVPDSGISFSFLNRIRKIVFTRIDDDASDVYHCL